MLPACNLFPTPALKAITVYRKLFRNCSTLSIGLILSRFSALIKLAIIASIFGTGDSMDAFLVAMAIPTAVLTVFGEGLYVSTVKLVSRHKGERVRTIDGWREVSSLFNFAVGSMVIVSVLYWALAPLLLRVVAPGFDHERLALASTLAQCVAPIMILVAVQYILHAILHVNGRFFIPALQFFLSSIVTIIVVLVLEPSLGVGSYALGSVAGELFCCLVCLIAVERLGVQYVFLWHHRSRGVRESLKLGVPTMASAGVLQVMGVTDRVFASGLAAGSVSALGYGLQLLTIPLALVRTVVDVSFPAVSVLFHGQASDRVEKLAKAVAACFKVLMVIGVPAGILLLLWREPLIAILLKRGKFDASSAAATAIVIFFYSFALVPLVVRYFLTRLSQSFGDSVLPLWSSILCTVASILANLALVPVMGNAAIALSLSLATTLSVVVLYLQFRRRIAVLRHSGIEAVVGKTILAGCLMAGAHVAAERVFDSVIIGGIFGAAAYGAALVALGVVPLQWLVRRAASAVLSLEQGLARGRA